VDKPRRILAVDPSFPPHLRYPRGPAFLEAIGPLGHRLSSLGRAVAIVGTRTPSREAWQYAHWLAATLAKAGIVIVSGGAYGIDSAAHEGALSVGGETLVVLPSAIDRWQPAGNSGLFRRVLLAGGGLVAFLERDQQPRYHDRNAAIAALADDVVVVAAPARSGARNTADEALRMKKPLWVVPGSPWDLAMQGCAALLTAHGARVLITPAALLGRSRPSINDVLFGRPWETSPDDPNPRPAHAAASSSEVPRIPARKRAVVTDRDRSASSSAPSPPRTLELVASSPEERSLLEALQKAPSTLDRLCLETALSPSRLAGLLLTWVVEGVVREGPPGWYRLVSS
jgi:DNA protecting protein DprA